MDELKKRVLELVREDARFTVRELAAMTSASEKDVKACILDMEKRGIILKYTAIVDDTKLGEEEVEALIEVKVNPQSTKGFDALAEEISAFTQVKSLYLMSGAYDLAVFITGKTLREAALFVSEKLSCMENVLSTATHFILKKYKLEGVCAGEQGSNRLAVHP